MEKKELPVDELITEERLKELGFEIVDYGDDPPYETYRKDGIEVSEYNGECWLIEMLDQNNIERPLKCLSELEVFFNGCGKSIYGATAYATKLQEAEEKIKDRDDKIKLLIEARRGEENSVTEMIALLEEVKSKHEAGLLPDRFIYEKIKTFLYGE